MDHRLSVIAFVMAALVLAACGGSTAPASASTAASKPPSSAAGASTGTVAAIGKPAAPPAAARTPVVEVARVPPGSATPEVAQLGAIPISSRPPLPAQYNQPIGPYTMYMEVIAGAAPSSAGLLTVPGCVFDSVFKRGMRVVFRYSVYDIASGGKPITDRDGSSTKVQLGPDQAADGTFAPRGGSPPPSNAPWTWVAVWDVPTDFALGNVAPSVLLNSNGKTSTLKTTDFNGMPIQIVD